MIVVSAAHHLLGLSALCLCTMQASQCPPFLPHCLQAGITDHPLFCYILAGEVALQGLIVQMGGTAFHTVPLTADQWGLCVGLGALTLGVRQALRHVKTSNG